MLVGVGWVTGVWFEIGSHCVALSAWPGTHKDYTSFAFLVLGFMAYPTMLILLLILEQPCTVLDKVFY